MLIEKIKSWLSNRKLDSLSKYIVTEFNVTAESVKFIELRKYFDSYTNHLKSGECTELSDLAPFCPEVSGLVKILDDEKRSLEIEMDKALESCDKHAKFIDKALNTYIDLVSQGCVSLSNDYKLVIHALSSECKGLSELLKDTGLCENDIKPLINNLVLTGMIDKPRGTALYTLTSYGKKLTAHCADCVVPDYHAELGVLIAGWSNLQSLVDDVKHKSEHKVNDYTELYQSTKNFFKKLGTIYHKKFEDSYSIVKGGLELQYGGGDHVTNYKKSSQGIKEILKILNKEKLEVSR